MIIKKNIPIYSICWLNYAEGGQIDTFYEPESCKELEDLCRSLYKQGKKFDVIGYTSNTYFLPSYNCDIMISTRKVRNVVYTDKNIIADCGVSVKSLAKTMVNEGIKGFEGLIDLPGTVAASVYGNASCYGCSINQLLESFDILRPDGKIETLTPDSLKIKYRSTALKSGKLAGVIISVRMRKEIGDKMAIMKQADTIHQMRKRTQPGPKDNLGSIYSDCEKWTLKGTTLHILAKVICTFVKPIKNISTTNIILYMMGHKELIPYIWGWNRFIWKDEESHELFWRYHQIHEKLFLNNDFEIIIKGNHVN